METTKLNKVELKLLICDLQLLYNKLAKKRLTHMMEKNPVITETLSEDIADIGDKILYTTDEINSLIDSLP